MNVRLCTVYAFANLIDLHPNAERQKWCSCSKANNNKPAQDKPFALSSPLYCPIVRESDSLGHTHTHITSPLFYRLLVNCFDCLSAIASSSFSNKPRSLLIRKIDSEECKWRRGKSVMLSLSATTHYGLNCPEEWERPVDCQKLPFQKKKWEWIY